MDIIDLQVSDKLVKLELTNYLNDNDYIPIDMVLDFVMDVDKMSIAKFNNLNKSLKIIIVRY